MYIIIHDDDFMIYNREIVSTKNSIRFLTLLLEKRMRIKMIFNSADFMVFLLIIILIYYICPHKIRNYWLLLASWYFYMQWNPVYIFLLLGVTVISYLAGIAIERNTAHIYLTFNIIIILGILVFFKYFHFGINCLNKFLEAAHIRPISLDFTILLPVGISFFSLQAIGYMIDVYRKEIHAEKNFFHYALFLSFFPQLVAGPIERSKNLLVQIKVPKKFSYNDLVKGTYLILYGLFCKMVIADRAAIVVDAVYGSPPDYPGFYIVFATVLFSFQIYCDFYGYTTIARGAALILGFRLTDNFNAPYFSSSVKEFWRRWHISLSYWFRDYLYIPLGGNRKGNLRKNLNLLLVFSVSGLWHGASLGYVLWGFLNGLYQVSSDILAKCRAKIYAVQDKPVFSTRLLKRAGTFFLITFAWMFFRAGGIGSSVELLRRLTVFNWQILFDGSLYQLGISKEYMFVVFAAILLLMGIDYQKYKGKNILETILKQDWWFRAACVAGLLITNLVFGCYGEMYDTQQFIYFQF